MKYLIFSALLFALLVTLTAYQTKKVLAKAEGCVKEGECGTHCSYEGHKFFPGSNRTLYREFTCLQMTCSDNYTIEFEP